MTEITEANQMENQQVELESDRAIVYLPHNSIEIEIVAKIYNGGNQIHTVSYTMDLDEIKESMRKAREGYIDENDKFVLTEKGKEYLTSLMKEQ